MKAKIKFTDSLWYGLLNTNVNEFCSEVGDETCGWIGTPSPLHILLQTL